MAIKTHEQMTKAQLIDRLKALETSASAVSVGLDQQRLWHELQNYQIELEQQNRELCQAQSLLEASRDRYADLYDCAPVGYVTLDDKGIIREANLTAAGMLGVERTRLAGGPFHLHVASADLAQFRTHLGRLEHPEEPVTTELLLARKDGGTLPVVMQSALVYDAERKTYLCRAALTDITVRLQAEQQLRDHEARLRAVLDTAVDGIITIDERGTIESFNQAAEKLFGHPAAEAIGQNISFLMPSPHREEHDRYLANYHATGERTIIGIGREVSGRRKDGSVFPLELSVSEVQLGARRSFTGFVRDITRRKQAEESLREEGDFVSAVLEIAGSLVIVLDETGRVVRFNRACERLTGYESEEILGKPIWDLLLPPEELAAVQTLFKKLQADQLPSEHENHWLTKTGELRLIAWSNTVLKTGDGKVKHIIGTGLDITERQRDELRRRLQYEMARLLATAGSLVEAVPKVLQTLAEAFQWDVGEFWEAAGGPKALRMVHVWHAPGKKLAAFVKHSLKLSFSMFDGLPGQAMSTQQPDWIPEIAQCPHFERRREAGRAGLRSAVAFPIQLHGQTLGVMAFLTHRPTVPDEDLLQMFAALGSQIGQFMERKNAEQALREANEFGQQVMNGAQAGIVVYDREGKFLVWNSFMEQLSGYRAQEVLGRRTLEVFPFLREQHFEEMFQRALAGEVFEGADSPFSVPEKGRQGWKVERFAPLRDVRQKIVGVIVAVRDITERRRLEVELLEISDREQRRIGHDLHDGLGQQLTALEMKCFLLLEDLSAEKFTTGHKQLQAQAQQLSQGLRECVTVTRSLARGMAPVNSKANGLMDALEQLALNAGVPGKIACRFLCLAPVMLEDSQVAGHLYRIAQEAVNNALKHARPHCIHIHLTQGRGQVRLQIKDDGRGLPRRSRAKPGMGLEVMRHRARVIGASLEITSKPGHGLAVTCRLPLRTP